MESLFEAGEPMIATLEGLEVVPNPFWGVEGGFTTDLTIIYLDGMPRKFAEQIPLDVIPVPEGMDLLDETGRFLNNEEFKMVPNLRFGGAATENFTIPAFN